MKLLVSERVYSDLHEAMLFYEAQEPGVGRRFLAYMTDEIDHLSNYLGTHGRAGKYHRALVQKYHTGIFYLIKEDTLEIRRVIDLRRDPKWIRRELKRSL